MDGRTGETQIGWTFDNLETDIVVHPTQAVEIIAETYAVAGTELTEHHTSLAREQFLVRVDWRGDCVEDAVRSENERWLHNTTSAGMASMTSL